MNDKRILYVSQGAGQPSRIVHALVDAGCQVLPVTGNDQALDVLEKQRFDVVVVSMSALEREREHVEHMVQLIHERQNALSVVVIGKQLQGSLLARDPHGALTLLQEPVEPHALLDHLQGLWARTTHAFDSGFVASDPSSRELMALAKRVAATDVAVLISGESGTGKEMLARYIHRCSVRTSGPFVAINCAAIPENMLEALLFGHEKGAFTGAHQASAGKFEQAQNGVLLLDEISEMALELQAKLLRVLQEREVERLGGQKTISLDVRVLATTNRSLRDEVQAGRFREDLYYRINVFPLCLRPLRERQGDIRPLAERLIARHTVPGGRRATLAESAVRAMHAYHWPGNVRELENIVQRALVLCDGTTVQADDLHFEQPVTESRTPDTLCDDLRTRESDLILQALNDGKGSRKLAAQRLGISPRTLRYKLARMRDDGISIPFDEKTTNT